MTVHHDSIVCDIPPLLAKENKRRKRSKCCFNGCSKVNFKHLVWGLNCLSDKTRISTLVMRSCGDHFLYSLTFYGLNYFYILRHEIKHFQDHHILENKRNEVHGN